MTSAPTVMALLTSLEANLDFDDIEALHKAVKNHRRADVFKRLKAEGSFTDDECDAMYKHLKQSLLGQQVVMLEVPKTNWEAVADSLLKPDGSPIDRYAPGLVIRYQGAIFQDKPRRVAGKMVIYTPQWEILELAKVSQVWQMVPKSAEARQ